MAHKKAGGSSRNGRDSQAKRLGVKVFGGSRMGKTLVESRLLWTTQRIPRGRFP